MLAKGAPDMGFTNLAHHLDLEWLKEGYRRTRWTSTEVVPKSIAKSELKRLDQNLFENRFAKIFSDGPPFPAMGGGLGQPSKPSYLSHGHRDGHGPS